MPVADRYSALHIHAVIARNQYVATDPAQWPPRESLLHTLTRCFMLPLPGLLVRRPTSCWFADPATHWRRAFEAPVLKLAPMAVNQWDCGA
jgi:hypothetical protein